MQAYTGRTATQTQPLHVNGRDWAGIPSASRRTFSVTTTPVGCLSSSVDTIIIKTASMQGQTRARPSDHGQQQELYAHMLMSEVCGPL